MAEPGSGIIVRWTNCRTAANLCSWASAWAVTRPHKSCSGSSTNISPGLVRFSVGNEGSFEHSGAKSQRRIQRFIAGPSVSNLSLNGVCFSGWETNERLRFDFEGSTGCKPFYILATSSNLSPSFLAWGDRFACAHRIILIKAF
uniref:Uncharacterized protein n=1 Tax=Salix viminalis TaxID=40686 RepID=A0A6N2M8R1_SALVM